jgi:hypothetical protein
MPYATADVPDPLDLTTIFCVAANTIPVLSRTPLAKTEASNSIHSESVGDAKSDTATLTVVLLDDLLHKLTVTTAKVLSGQVYRVVFVAAARSPIPNLPVAIF